MIAKDYLQEIGTLQARIYQLKSAIDYKRERLTTLRAINYEKPKVQNSQNKDFLLEALEDIRDMESQLVDCIAEYSAARGERLELIFSLDKPDYMIILHARYLEGKSWEQIIAEQRQTSRSIYRKHREALSAIQEILDKAEPQPGF